MLINVTISDFSPNNVISENHLLGSLSAYARLIAVLTGAMNKLDIQSQRAIAIHIMIYERSYLGTIRFDHG
jgi:hypothetical protein